MNQIFRCVVIALFFCLVPAQIFAQIIPTISIGEPGDSSYRLGNSSSFLRLSQSFTAVGTAITSIQVPLSRVGSPGNVITVSIKSSLAGTPLYTSTITPSQVASTIITSPTWVTLTPSTPIPVTTGATYFVTLSVPSANSKHYYRWRTNSMNSYSGGTFYKMNSVQTGYDGLLRVLAPAASPAPTVSISASPSSVTSGESTILTWNSANATSCTASGAWTGTKTVFGSETVTPTTNSTYTLSCVGTGGTVTSSANLTVVAAPVESPDGSSITATGTITDANGAKWTISGGVVYKNGVATLSANVTLLFYSNHTVYHQNASGGWWSWVNNSWQATTDPRTTVPVTPDFSKLHPSCYIARSAPIIKNGDFFAGSAWNDPHILKVGNQYVMYASSDLNWDQDVKIYRLISDDGASWTLSPSTPVFTKPVSTTSWDSKAAETPGVVYFKGLYYLFYTGYSVMSDTTSFKIGYATSPDGINFTRAATFVVEPSNPTGAPDLDFKQYMVGEPGPVVFNDKIYLYFTAMGADASVGTMLQTIGVVESSDGLNWGQARQVLKPNQTLYPRSGGWAGYSTPHAAVFDGKVHLYVDVANEIPEWKQVKLHHAVSNDGITSWTQDAAAIFDRSQFYWTTEEIRSPAVLLDGKTLNLWFAGHNSTANPSTFVMGIGLATCEL